MPNYQISIVIENKPGISDPEGDTILNDLVLKDKNTNITQIRSGTILKFSITDSNEQSAKDSILKICDDSTSILEIGGGCGILAAVVDKNISPKRHDIYEPIKLNIERIKSQDLLTTTSIFENAVVSSDDSEKNLFFRERERVFGSGFYSEGQISLDSDKFSEVQKKSIDKIKYYADELEFNLD